MADKIKGFISRNWEQTLAGIIGASVTALLGRAFATIGNFLGAVNNMNATLSILAWIVFAIGLSVIVYVFIHVSKRVITGKKDDLDVVQYDGLQLEKDAEDEYFTQYARTGANLSREIKLWVIVHNTYKPVYDCAVDLENLEYKGRHSSNEWVSSPSGYDRKAMKWDVGYSPNEGKIDISTRTRKKLEIAVAFPQPMATMELSHLDGYSKRGHLLDGIYRATVRVDGKVFAKDLKRDIKPRWYEIEFEYQHSSARLKLLEIKDYEPPKEVI